jgi:hypothetical protein
VEKQAGRAVDLQKLHGSAELSELALLAARRLAGSDLAPKVQVQPVRIDSLPQAVGRPSDWRRKYALEEVSARHAERVKCKLADLLYVVKVVDNSVMREQAVLVQVKMSAEGSRLPGGSSTRMERTLLTALGLMHVARYLVIAKAPGWTLSRSPRRCHLCC